MSRRYSRKRGSCKLSLDETTNSSMSSRAHDLLLVLESHEETDQVHKHRYDARN